VSHNHQVQRFRNELSRRLSPSACDSLIALSQRMGPLDSMERIVALLRPEGEGDVMSLDDQQDKERDVR
jgi:hypothetical protein